MSWSWKTKPRSIIKTIQWFPYFASLKGENWDKKSLHISKKDKKAIHPIRRTYVRVGADGPYQRIVAAGFLIG